MINFNSPSFISIEIDENSVYKNIISSPPSEMDISMDNILKELINYLSDKVPLGISVYGDLKKYNLFDLFEFCLKNNIQLGYDLACNNYTIKYIKQHFENFQLFRLLLFSLDAQTNDRFFPGNELKYIHSFVDNNIAGNKGRVIVIPVVQENLFEIEDIIDYALKNGYRANPLPIPSNCALRMGAQPLTKSEYIHLAEVVSAYFNRYGDRIYLDMPAAFNIIKKKALCPAFRLSVDITSRGYIRPCKFFDIYFKDIYSMDKLWKENRNIIPLKCQRCDMKFSCGGGCIANADFTDGCDIYCLRDYMISDCSKI